MPAKTDAEGLATRSTFAMRRPPAASHEISCSVLARELGGLVRCGLERSSTEVLAKITEEEKLSRISCQISTELGTLGTSTVREAWSANVL